MRMKQVIVANKSLNMSPGKLAAMVAHGSIAFLTNWMKENVDSSRESFNGYRINEAARFDPDTFNNWINGSFTKVVLEATEPQMENIVQKAHARGMKNQRDFFNIVDDSTEFCDIPCWAVIAFRPLVVEDIDPITGNLNLYGHDENGEIATVCDDDELPFK